MEASRRPTLREEHADLSKKKDMGEVEVTEEDTEIETTGDGKSAVNENVMLRPQRGKRTKHVDGIKIDAY